MANYSVAIKATQKLIGDIADKVAKTLTISTTDGLTGGGALNSDLKLAVDMDYIKANIGEIGGGNTYTFSGDEYIDVVVSEA